jgi:hypothetical protein
MIEDKLFKKQNEHLTLPIAIGTGGLCPERNYSGRWANGKFSRV